MREDPLFWTKVDATAPCWEWQGARSLGYGKVKRRVDGVARSLWAHRYSWELLVGPIPAGLHLDHLCRNRGCVNPDHLEPVSQGENVRRGAIGNLNTAKREARVTCSHGHPWEKYTWIDKRNGQRQCRECSRLRAAEVAARKKVS